MRRLFTAILAIGIALVFLLYMVTYTVGYNETVIITTFDRATPADPAALEQGQDSGSVIVEPGLNFKWPWPIQRVQTYPTQLQVLQDVPEQLPLSDGNTIIINMALTWRIQDPLAFSISLGTLDAAQDKLLAQMRDLRSVFSTDYAFSDLVNEDPSLVKLDEIEDEIANQLRQRLASIEPNYGIAVEEVLIGRMLYHASTAESVNERMTATQERRAQEIRSSGDSDAEAIVSEANSISNQLRSFADTVGTRIESIGDREANQYLARFADGGAADQDLAIFLRQLEAIEQILANRTTFLLDARTFSPLDVLVYGHGGEGNLSRMFDQPEAPAETLDVLAVPYTPEAQAQRMLERVEAMQQRIIELEQQLQSLEPAPVPVRAITDDARTEARP